jgi:hypothetical protein
MAWPGNGFIDQMADNLCKPARRLDDIAAGTGATADKLAQVPKAGYHVSR